MKKLNVIFFSDNQSQDVYESVNFPNEGFISTLCMDMALV